MSKDIKVLCAISHGYYKPWIEIATEGQSKTWLADELPQGFEVLHYHGSPLSSFGQKLDRLHERVRWTNRYIGYILKTFDALVAFPFLWWEPKVSSSALLPMKHPSIHIHSPDSYLTFRWKSRAMMKYALENYDFDFLFMTTTSSYIRPAKLLSIASEFPLSKFYAGAKAYEGATFAAGSNRFLSRDLVEYIVTNKTSYLPHLIEDVSLARSLTKVSTPLFFINHLDD